LGVTVHFEGRLKGPEALGSLLNLVEKTARAKTWLTEKFENSVVTLSRVRADDEEWDYIGPTKGIILYLHEDCDPVRLEFDQDFYIQEFVKTQFAGAHSHIELIALLRDLKQFFDDFKVEDEGEYWETGSEAVLTEHIGRCDEAIAEFARQNPNAQIKVRTPEGRFMDLLE